MPKHSKNATEFRLKIRSGLMNEVTIPKVLIDRWLETDDPDMKISGTFTINLEDQGMTLTLTLTES